MALFSLRKNERRRAYSETSNTEEAKPLDPVQIEDPAESAMFEAELHDIEQSLRHARLYLRTILALIVIAAVWYLITIQAVIGRSGIKYAAPARLLKTPVPPLEDTKVIFEKNFIYTQRPVDGVDRAWDKLLPSGRGFVYIPDWESYDLPPGQDTPDGPIYSTALFHQVHCLGQIRKYTWQLLDSIEKNNTALQTSMVQMLLGRDGGDHLHHCFDYLRQSIQCSGDMSMEWPRTEPDGRRFAVDGWGIPHTCKDWSGIMRYMDENHFNHSTVDEIAPH